MLYSNHRSPAADHELDSDELEDLQPARVRSTLAFPHRPEVSFRDESDERTMMMPARRSTRSLSSPAPAAFRRPERSFSDEVTALRPSVSASGNLLAMRAQPRRQSALAAAPSQPEVVVPRAEASQSGPLAMVVNTDALASTALVRLAAGRPTATWAAALVALGLFAGLVGSLVMRTSDRALPAAAAAAPAIEMAQPIRFAAVQAPAPVAAAPVQAPAPVVVESPAPVAAAPVAAPVVVESPAPVAAAPVAAAPVSKVVVQAVPVVRSAAVSKPVVAAAPAYKAPAAQAAHKASKPSGDDFEQASAADALAKAQLEAALNR
jgi:hypothetical protein